MNKAIFLAAGSNNRLKTLYPKPLLQIQNETIIGRSIRFILQFVDRVEIITNTTNFHFFNEHFGNICAITINNQAEKGSLSTLLTSTPDEINYIFDSDIIYHTDEIRPFFESIHLNSILTSNVQLESDDNVFVSITKNNFPLISKTYHNETSEFVGIACLDRQTLQNIQLSGTHWEEHGLVQIFNLNEYKIPNLKWNEIDTYNHWAKVKQRW